MSRQRARNSSKKKLAGRRAGCTSSSAAACRLGAANPPTGRIARRAHLRGGLRVGRLLATGAGWYCGGLAMFLCLCRFGFDESNLNLLIINSNQEPVHCAQVTEAW